LRIGLLGGPGDDAIETSLTGLENEGGRFALEAVGGEGNDRLSLDAIDPCFVPGSRTRIAMSGGLGDDTIDATLSGLESEGGEFFLEVDGGFGIDAMSVRAIVPCILPESELRIALLGGPGADAIDTSLTGLENEGGLFVMEALGGEGADRLALNAMDPCLIPGSRTRIAMSGGPDDDALSALLGGAPETRERAELDGALQLDLEGGRGDDSIALDMVNAEIRGRTNVTAEGDAGNDRVRLGIAADARVVGSLDLAARGGIGNDVMESFIIPCILPEAIGRFLFDGGDGNDRIDAHVGMHEHDTGALAVLVRGGLGDDDLTLALSGTEFLLSLQALVDGGDGRDAAHVTRDVRVANCEEIEILDEPR
jgi:Ca2+-binding RTX toxin-like protein